MDANELKLLVDLHKHADRQGPGGEKETLRALELAGLDRSRPLKIADIGCGTGASTLLLARELDAKITAVDFLPDFLEELQFRAHSQGVADKISTLTCSMEDLPFADQEFDLIWSEGAIYNIGFQTGVANWGRFLKPGGKLVVSEITWITAERPQEIESYWQGEYPEIDVASSKIGILEHHGYSPEAYFILPQHCWNTNYYRPIQNSIDAFLKRHQQSGEAKAIALAEEHEIALYEQYGHFYSYGVYIAKKLEK
ncbi:MAG: SAM-dependent methyltransferase [Desulfuromonas sp.]|nr:MAG: SAM-dependent methyltransferase [Desulfuromonas sp.]